MSGSPAPPSGGGLGGPRDDQLSESERRYRILFEHHPQPMWVYDIETLRFLAVNDAAVRSYGYPLERFLAMTIAEIRPEEDVPALRESVARAAEGIEREPFWRHRRADGHLISVEISSHPIEFAGRPAQMVMAIDVTARRAAEEALRSSEREQRRLAEELEIERRRLTTAQAVAKVGSWETDLDSFAVVWSSETHRIFETDENGFEASHARFLELVHPDDRPKVDAAFRDSLSTRDLCAVEHRILFPDGRVKHLEERWQTYADEHGRAVRAMGTCQDITERRDAEERLVEQAALLDAAHEAILVKGLDDRIHFWSRGAERAYGWSAEEAVGQKSSELLFGGDSALLERATSQLMSKRQWQGEMRHRTRDGRERIVDVRWTLLCAADGSPKSVLSINNDVTERRNLESQLLRVQRLESIGRLAGGIAHDLNNVLAPILLSVELLQEGETRADRLDLLATLESSANHGAELVRQVLSFARGLEGRKSILDLATVARDVTRIARETFPKNIEIVLHTAGDLRPVSADATQMHQVLMNLLVNARDAMPGGGRLTVTIENAVIDEAHVGRNPESHAGPHLLLEVVDTGVGISRPHLDRLFEPFFTTKELGRGTGLGLPTVHTIVRGHGGFIDVDSEEGRGARFRVYLPSEPSSAGDDAPVVHPRAELHHGEGECILVVDDEPPLRQVARRILERFGYRVLLAEHGAEAVSIFALQREEIAAVLTDMSMPVMDGPATILALRAIDPGVRIVGTSGLADPNQISKTSGAGLRYFLPKPFTAETLLRVIREALTQQG